MRYLILFLSLLILGPQAYSQRSRAPKKAKATSGQAKYRHIQGIKGVDLAYGQTQWGNSFKGSGFFFIANNHWVKTSLTYNSEKIFNGQIQRYGVDVLYGYSPFNLAGILFVNTQAGIGAFFDTSNLHSDLGTKNTINAGPVLGIEPEWYFLKNSSLFFFYDQRLMVKPNFGRWRYSYGIGVRVSFR